MPQDYDVWRSFGSNPTADELIRGSLGVRRERSQQSAGMPLSQLIGYGMGRQQINTEAFGSRALPAGYSTLLDILSNQGRTDPRQMNLDLADISRTTQGQQQDLRGQLAGAGFERSGLGAALGAAIGQSGAERRSRRISEETQLAEQRKRDDLQLLLDLIINPQQQAYATSQGVSLQNMQNKRDDRDKMIALLGTALAACWVARRIYGVRNQKWRLVRRYILTMAPAPLRDFYLARGELIAASMTDEDVMVLRPHFDRMAALGGV